MFVVDMLIPPIHHLPWCHKHSPYDRVWACRRVMSMESWHSCHTPRCRIFNSSKYSAKKTTQPYNSREHRMEANESFWGEFSFSSLPDMTSILVIISQYQFPLLTTAVVKETTLPCWWPWMTCQGASRRQSDGRQKMSRGARDWEAVMDLCLVWKWNGPSYYCSPLLQAEPSVQCCSETPGSLCYTTDLCGQIQKLNYDSPLAPLSRAWFYRCQHLVSPQNIIYRIMNLCLRCLRSSALWRVYWTSSPSWIEDP